ncbi:unnamed protein product [Paramecium primaurelia]|uniref:Uncharacterized protein n=1 Tax=Paramecium primaurelia TaxID=5886 RepID=A0A8S1NTA0_PARPR|nr:unnamed protein product [Paramecium primaurelia]
MTDDIFMGLTSVQQFDAKLKVFNQKRHSMSQISTAHNSTLKSMKSTIGDGIPMVSFLDTFVERVHYLVQHCNELQDRNECVRIALELGISFYKVQSLSSQQEREDFIIKQLQNQVIEQLRQWKIKMEQRELQRNKTKVIHENENNLNIFNWVEIHTKFRSLKKKLKFALIEILNSKENSKMIYSQDNITNITYKKPDMQSIIDELNNLLHKIKKQQKITTNIQWSNEKETDFKVKRNSAKHRLGMLVNSNSFNTIGMGEYIITHDKDKQDQQRREELLFKYDTQQGMTEEELLYLVNTSNLLNKCSNKKLLQTVINQLDSEIISDIELTIAENILNQYYKISKEMNQSRHLYLKVNQKAKEKERTEINIQQTNKGDIKKLKFKFLKMLREMKEDRKDTFKENTEKYKIFQQEYRRGNPIANPLVWKFKDIMMSILERKKREKREKKLATTNDSNKPIFPSKTESLTLKVVMRKTHPSSKVIIKSQPDLNTNQSNVTKIQDYLLKLKKKDYEMNKQNFSQFYSGGPIRQRPYAHQSLTIEESDITLPYGNKWITPEIELAAANKIKKAFKAYISKKRFERAISQKKFLTPQPAKFYRLVQKLNEKRKQIDVEECYKSLKIALQQQQYRKKTIKKQQIDYSKITIPKTMIQLKLKQRKLFLALKVNNTLWMDHSGFIFDSNDVNCYDVDMYCPLYYAAKQQSVLFCNFLLINGADVNMPCKDGETPTFAAFASGNIVIINLFVSNGADIDKLNNEGKTPLCYCSIELLKELNLQYRPCFIK